MTDISVSDWYLSFTWFWHKNNFHRMLVNRLTADSIFKSHHKFNGKKMEFSNYLLMFGRSPIAIDATCLAHVYSKFNAESNPHICLIYRRRASSKIRAFIINVKIFLKWRIYPSPIVNVLERHFENTCTKYVCWNVKKIGVIGHLRHFGNKNNFRTMLVNPLTADNIFKSHQKFNGKKCNFLTFCWCLGEAQSPSMPLIWGLFILNLMLNRTLIFVWYTEEEKVAKFSLSI